MAASIDMDQVHSAAPSGTEIPSGLTLKLAWQMVCADAGVPVERMRFGMASIGPVWKRFEKMLLDAAFALDVPPRLSDLARAAAMATGGGAAGIGGASSFTFSTKSMMPSTPTMRWCSSWNGAATIDDPAILDEIRTALQGIGLAKG